MTLEHANQVLWMSYDREYLQLYMDLMSRVREMLEPLTRVSSRLLHLRGNPLVLSVYRGISSESI